MSPPFLTNATIRPILMANGMTMDVYHRDNCIALDIAFIVWTTDTKSARARARVALGRDGLLSLEDAKVPVSPVPVWVCRVGRGLRVSRFFPEGSPFSVQRTTSAVTLYQGNGV